MAKKQRKTIGVDPLDIAVPEAKPKTEDPGTACRLTVYVTYEERQALRKVAYEKDTSISAILREAIQRYLNIEP